MTFLISLEDLMKFILIILSSLLACSALACGEKAVLNHKKLPAGGRSSLHGMVLFGNGTYFIEHIPMLHPPHDFQMIASVELKNLQGKLVSPDFSKGTFTIRPTKNFSLNDFLNSDIKSFQAEIFQGSFEQDGKILDQYGIVNVEVQKFDIIRQLPNSSDKKVMIIKDIAGNMYESQMITPENNVQQIINKSESEKIWCALGPDFFELCID